MTVYIIELSPGSLGTWKTFLESQSRQAKKKKKKKTRKIYGVGFFLRLLSSNISVLACHVESFEVNMLGSVSSSFLVDEGNTSQNSASLRLVVLFTFLSFNHLECAFVFF